MKLFAISLPATLTLYSAVVECTDRIFLFCFDLKRNQTKGNSNVFCIMQKYEPRRDKENKKKIGMREIIPVASFIFLFYSFSSREKTLMLRCSLWVIFPLGIGCSIQLSKTR